MDTTPEPSIELLCRCGTRYQTTMQRQDACPTCGTKPWAMTPDKDVRTPGASDPRRRHTKDIRGRHTVDDRRQQPE